VKTCDEIRVSVLNLKGHASFLKRKVNQEYISQTYSNTDNKIKHVQKIKLEILETEIKALKMENSINVNEHTRNSAFKIKDFVDRFLNTKQIPTTRKRLCMQGNFYYEISFRSKNHVNEVYGSIRILDKLYDFITEKESNMLILHINTGTISNPDFDPVLDVQNYITSKKSINRFKL